MTQAQWEEFVWQKTSEEGLALSQRNRELAMSNIHKVHLGPGGYQRQVEKWWREREAAIAAGQPDPFEGLDKRGWMWLRARKPKIVDGKLKFDQPETEALVDQNVQTYRASEGRKVQSQEGQRCAQYSHWVQRAWRMC